MIEIIYTLFFFAMTALVGGAIGWWVRGRIDLTINTLARAALEKTND